MKLLITKNKYGISAKIRNQDDNEIPTYFLQITMSKENAEKIDENNAFLINVKDGIFSTYAKKDGSAGLKLFVTEFTIDKVFSANNKQVKSAPAGYTLKPIDEEILPF